MAWSRNVGESFIPGSTIYSFTEVDWYVDATKCTYRHLGGVTSPYYWNGTATGKPTYWDGDWHNYQGAGSDHFGGYGDLKLFDFWDEWTRGEYDFVRGLGCTASFGGYSGGSYLSYTIPHYAKAPATITGTRVSDNSVNLSWTLPDTSLDSVKLEVSIDGGSWSEFASVSGSATSASYTQASADHSYRFRARGYYQASYSSYTLPTAAVAMTPSAPQSISVAASGGTNVAVTLTNNSPVATSLEYQTSTDGGSTWSASTTVSGSPVTSFSTSVSGTALIRVRNKNATGVSDWLVSDPITTICPPAPPTLRTPSGSVYDMAQGDIEFSWLHNSLDGSTQTAYELRYAINGGAWTTLTGTTAQSRTVSIGTFSAGNAVTWQVRTKGADANYSDWSQTGAFSVYTAPTLSITSPGATITGMPINLTATYSDMAGFTCQAATVSLTKDGRTLFSEPATINGTSITSSLDVSEFLPTNGESYTVVLTARSSSGLSTSANATFTVDFVPPKAAELSIVNDPETGYASLLVQGVPDDSVEGTTQTFEWNQLNNHADYVDALLNNYYFVQYVANTDVKIQNHKYLFMEHIVSTVEPIRVTVSAGTSSAATADVSDHSGYASGSDVAFFFTPNATILQNCEYFWIRPLRYGSLTTATFSATNIALYDLTAMFGAGNEPTTVDAFKATSQYQTMAAKGELYDYDAGSTQHYPVALPTEEGEYIHSVQVTGEAQRIVSPTDSYTGSTNTQYESSEGYVRSLTVEGKSEKWNQLTDITTATTTTTNNVTFTVANGTVTVSGTASAATVFNILPKATGKANHKLFITGCPSGGSATTYRLKDGYGIQSDTGNGCIDEHANDNCVAQIIIASGYTATNLVFKPMICDLTAIFGAGNEPATVDAFKATDVYKAKLAAGELYDYDAGSLVSIEGVGVRGRNLANFTASSNYTVNADGTLTINATGGFNINFAALPSARYWVYMKVVSGGVSGDSVFTWQGSTYYNEYIGTSRQGSSASALSSIWVAGSANFTVGTVMQLMVSAESSTDWEPYRNTTITAPLRSAGSVHDTLMADADSWTVARRVGVVDLGTLNWTYQSSLGGWFKTQTPLSEAQSNETMCAALVWFNPNASNITAQTVPAVAINAKADGTAITGAASAKDVIVKHPSYTDAAAFKTAMSGVYLFYELATPTTDTETSMDTIEIGSAFTVATDLDSTFSMTVDDGVDPYVLTTTGVGSVSGGTITHQPLTLDTNAETYTLLNGEWLAGINDVHDVYEDGVITRRVGCVDLGSLTWGYFGQYSYPFFRTSIAGASGANGSVLCALFDTKSGNYGTLNTDMSCAMYAISGVAYFVARDDSMGNDAAAFKTAMSGVLLYYELATPTEVTAPTVEYEPLEVPDTATLNAYTPSDFTIAYGLGLDEIDKVSVARINPDGTMTPLLTDGQLGAGIVDKYAPLNTEYQYAVTTKASSQAVKTVYVDNIIESDFWFAYWGENVAKAKWNPDNGGIQITRPQKTRVYYAGRKDPVSYDGHAVALTETPSWMFIGKDEVDAFVNLIEDGGRGIYKSCDGWVYHADFDLTLTPKYTAIGYYGGASLGITRIAGDRL